jgi:hypothetical protein
VQRTSQKCQDSEHGLHGLPDTGCGGVALTSSIAELMRIFAWFEFISLGPRATLTPISEMALLVKSAFVDWTWYGVDRIAERCALLSKTSRLRSEIIRYFGRTGGQDGNAQIRHRFRNFLASRPEKAVIAGVHTTCLAAKNHRRVHSLHLFHLAHPVHPDHPVPPVRLSTNVSSTARTPV